MKRTPLRRRTRPGRGAPAAGRSGGVPYRRNKFGVSDPTARTHGGVEYHSKLEAKYAAQLDLRAKGIGPASIKSWRRQVPVKLEVNGNLITTYIVDFVVTHHDGREEYVECKGFETDTWKIKDKLFRALYPDRRLTVVR